MSSRDWRSYIAIVGGLIVLLTLAPWITEAVALGRPSGGIESKLEDQQRDAHEQCARNTIFCFKDQPQREAYEPKCEGTDKTNCLLTWRNTRATEAQARAAYLQLKFAEYSTWLLLATFAATLAAAIFAHRAAVATQASADEAKRSANAADDALRHTVTASQREQRPYVTSDDYVMHWMHVATDVNVIESWRVSAVWRNCGQTPATNVHARINADFFENMTTPDSVNWQDEGDYDTQARDLGPGQSISSQIEIPIDKLIRAWNGEGRIFHWGWIEYDGITQGARHRTEACAELRFTVDPTLKDARWVNSVRTEFNASDERCVHKIKT